MKRFPGRIQIAAVWASLLVLSLAAGAPLLAGSQSIDVTVQQARELVQQRAGQKDFVILDVRTPEEFADGHLSGAVNVNLLAPDFTARLGALNRGKTYLVYCRTGHRSTQAVQAMLRLRFRSVYNMAEGIVGWQKRGFSIARTQ
jgi:rhodanese-related sulfurtransferase